MLTRSIAGALMLVALLVPIVAGAQDTPAGAEAEPGLTKLTDLAARFGRGGWQLSALDLSMRIMMADSEQTFLELTAETAELLDACNAPYDLAAPPEPTGDELYDRYAQLVDQRIGAVFLGEEQLGMQAMLGGLSEDSFSVALLPDEVLEMWESEWRNDPRYWELVAFTVLCRRDSDEHTSMLSPDQDPSDQKIQRLRQVRELLEEAQSRGAVRGQTLLLLYRVICDLEDVELAPLTTYETLTSSTIRGTSILNLPERPEFTDEQLALSRELHTRFDADELAVLDAAVEADPELAWAHYYRAMYWFERGEPELGLADLIAGNQAPDLRFPLPFPLNAAIESMDAEEPAGSAAVAGAIMLASLRFDYLAPSWLKIKEHLREQFVAVNLSGDTAVFDAWHQFACRIPYSQQENTIFQIVPVVVVSMIRDYVWEQRDQLTDEQAQTLMHLTGWHDSYMDAPRTYDVPSIEAAMVLGVAGGMHGVCVAFYAGQSAVLEIARGNLHFFEDAARLRYPELQLPEALRKYEAMTPEHRRLRSRAGSRGWRVGSAVVEQAEQLVGGQAGGG
jgi:hypothetical protein